MKTESERPLPLFLIKPGTVSKEDIQRAQESCGICIVECSEPEAAHFLMPPLDANLPDHARASMALMRWITSAAAANHVISVGDLSKFFVQVLMEGHKPQPAQEVREVKKR